MTQAQRLAEVAKRRAVAEMVFDLKQEYSKMLPMGVKRAQEVLRSKAKGDKGLQMRVLEMIADRLYGRPAQAITGAGGGPLLVSFTQMLAGIDGSRNERFALN